MLSKQFLDEYRTRRDPFETLLSRSVYRSTYQRAEDRDWVDTLTRVVNANIRRDPNATKLEAEFLFDSFFNMYCLPAGRSLYQGGTALPDDASYNCAYVTLSSPEDWGWIMRHAMLGVGVGVGYQRISELPEVKGGEVYFNCIPSHPNYDEVEFDNIICLKELEVADSREGWADCLIGAIRAAIYGRTVSFDVSPVRARGSKLVTFGGFTSGFEPLVTGIRKIVELINRRKNQKLRVIDCSDITNIVGSITKMGNVRRTALINVAPWNNEFLDAKINYSKETAYRHTSNNSVGIYTKQDENYVIENAHAIALRNRYFGEPGIANLYRAQLDNDSDVEGFNPCAEIPLRNKEFCCVSELILPRLKLLPVDHQRRVVQVLTRFTLRERLKQHSCEIAERNRQQYMRIGVGATGISSCTDYDYHWLKYHVVDSGMSYADDLGVNIPCKFTTVKPGGTTPLIAGLHNPGVKSPHSPYFIRRVRYGVYQPMTEALLDAKVPFELDEMDESNRTLVFEYPCKAESPTYATTESARSQLERQFKIQSEYADNAVSATTTFDPSDIDELAALIAEYTPKLKSISFLPNNNGNYRQAPYEEITKEEYERRFAQINHNHPLVQQDEMSDSSDCVGGVCPIR